MTTLDGAQVLVRVEPTDRDGRQISSHIDPADSLRSREADIERGIAAGTRVISTSIPTITSPAGWSLDSVEATFGITLGAEGSVIVSKASLEASFEVTVSYRRNSPAAAVTNDG
jgi:hypothetical protein